MVASLAPTRGIVTPEAVVLEFDTAGIPSRAIARVIDTFVVGSGAMTVLALVLPVLSSDANAVVVAALLVSILAVFGYPCVCETVWGRTLGHSVLGLRVVTEEGGPVRFRQAAIRSALQVLDLYLVPVGVVAIVSALAGRRDQRLGDRLAGTLVVRSSPLTTQSRAIAFPPLPGYEGFVDGLDVGGLGTTQYEVLRSFLTRVQQLTPAARAQLAAALAEGTARAIGRVPPPAMHPEIFLSSVAAAYQRRHGGPAAWLWLTGRPTSAPWSVASPPRIVPA